MWPFGKSKSESEDRQELAWELKEIQSNYQDWLNRQWRKGEIECCDLRLSRLATGQIVVYLHFSPRCADIKTYANTISAVGRKEITEAVGRAIKTMLEDYKRDRIVEPTKPVDTYSGNFPATNRVATMQIGTPTKDAAEAISAMAKEIEAALSAAQPKKEAEV